MLPICPFEISIQKPLPKDYPNSLITFANHIKARRLERELSKVDLAKILNVSHKTIWEWEDRGKRPFAPMMKKIIEWLGYVPPLDVNPESLGGRLFIYRCIHGLGQKEMAQMLRITSLNVVKIERNELDEPFYCQKVEDLINNSLILS